MNPTLRHLHETAENRYCATCGRTEKFVRHATTEECRVCGRVLLIVVASGRAGGR